MEEIKSNHQNERDRKKAALDEWKRIKGKEATYLCIIEAFFKDDDVQLIDAVFDYLKEGTVF